MAVPSFVLLGPPALIPTLASNMHPHTGDDQLRRGQIIRSRAVLPSASLAVSSSHLFIQALPSLSDPVLRAPCFALHAPCLLVSLEKFRPLTDGRSLRTTLRHLSQNHPLQIPSTHCLLVLRPQRASSFLVEARRFSPDTSSLSAPPPLSPMSRETTETSPVPQGPLLAHSTPCGQPSLDRPSGVCRMQHPCNQTCAQGRLAGSRLSGAAISEEQLSDPFFPSLSSLSSFPSAVGRKQETGETVGFRRALPWVCGIRTPDAWRHLANCLNVTGACRQ
ncbi:hypothetical protein HDV57DRAFT_322378 [Trichoderma longibrachiatum]|uniref:Uncharacterized protein n=1 Tax=Trichoderma longibrachiatum ATCC 18648 TaxID=983965 RepID=A0A2T4BW34_TRILO|nr:hypothetical protein M440DRAFT_133349 [Trichoderma longibrachiatum ATCC 18648]